MPARPDLDALGRLLREATPGPWSSEISGDGMYLNAGRIGLMAGIHAEERPDDAALIAAAVNALHFLLAEAQKVETLTKERDALGSQIASAADFLNTCLRESNLSRGQVGVEDLRPGIDALYLRFIRTKVEFDALIAQVETLREELATLRSRASSEPLGVDVSDYSDEWAQGFLAGQANALDEYARALGG